MERGRVSETFEWPTVGIALRVDGQEYPVPHVWIGESLLAVLRERLDLDEPRDGCSVGECGACVVELDGVPTASCLVPAVAAVERQIRTPLDPSFAAAKTALATVNAAPCGHCGPGLAVAITALLRRNPDPGPAAVREALAGHLCQCADFGRWVAAVDAVKAAESGARGGGTASASSAASAGAAGATPAEAAATQPPDTRAAQPGVQASVNPANLSISHLSQTSQNIPSTVNAQSLNQQSPNPQSPNQQPSNSRNPGDRAPEEQPPADGGARRPPGRPPGRQNTIQNQDRNPRAGR